MAPAFVHLPSYFAAHGYIEHLTQDTGPYAEIFKCTYWQRVNRSPELKHDFDTYMTAHKKGGSSLVNLLPLSTLVQGYDKSFPVLLVDIGGGMGHQCMELKARYPSLEGDIVVQDLRISKELELVGVKGMDYNFFTPQPIKSKLHQDCKYMVDILTLQMLDFIITAPYCMIGPTKNAWRSSRLRQMPCDQVIPDY